MQASAALPVRSFILVGICAVTSAALLIVSNGNLGAAAAPFLGVAFLAALVRLPLRISLLATTAVALLFHNPGAKPMMGKWVGPLTLGGALVYDNWRKLIGADALRFSSIELVLLLLVLVVAARTLVGNNVDRHLDIPAIRPIRVALGVSFLVVVLQAARGLVLGGDLQQMIWQFRQVLWLPIIAGLFLRACKTPGVLTWLVGILFGVATLRSLEGLFFYFGIARPGAMYTDYIMTHDDSMLFVCCFIVAFLMGLEWGVKKIPKSILAVLPIIALAMIFNTRRLAYVSLMLAGLSVLVLMKLEIRQRIIKTGLLFVPLFLAYVAVGTQSKAAVFAPVRSLVSVADDENASNESRDVENYNLVYTMKKAPLLGLGFGHDYIELIATYSIEEFMSNYRYIAHNSILWLFSLVGVLGFTGLWAYIVVTIFFAARTHRRRDGPHDATTRIAVSASTAVIMVYMVQSFGDMGAISWMAPFLVGAAVGVVGNVASPG